MSWADLTDLDGLECWFAPSGLPAVADGAPVETWIDASGRGYDLAAAGTLRPALVAAGPNGLPAVAFAGSPQRLSSAASVAYAGGSLCSAVVFRADVAALGVPWSFQTSNPPVHMPDRRYVMTYSDGRVLCGGAGHYSFSCNRLALSAWSLWADCRGGGQNFNRLNGAPAFFQSHSGWATTDVAAGACFVHLGSSGYASGYLQGQVAEFVLWDDSTGIDVVWVEGYLAHKYALTLPAGHLFAVNPPASGPQTRNAAAGPVFVVND